MHRSQGVTLAELLTVVAVVAVLSTLAIPSFTTFQRNASRTRAVNDFFHAVFLARSEAIKRNSVVAICKSPDGRTCARGAIQWSAGWLVFHNKDHDKPATVDPDEPVLRHYEGWPGGTITSTVNAFSFRPLAQGVVNGTVAFCDDRGSSEARAVIISQTGRPRISRKNAENKPIRCP